MSYFVTFNRSEKLLWIRGRKNEGEYEGFDTLPGNDAMLKNRFRQEAASDIMITSLGSTFGDDGYDYYGAIGVPAVVGAGSGKSIARVTKGSSSKSASRSRGLKDVSLD